MKMSEALPFVECPQYLDGTMAGDVGFDPLGLSDYTKGPFDTPAEHLGWMREAEIKHGTPCLRERITTTERVADARRPTHPPCAPPPPAFVAGRICMIGTVGWIAVDLGLRAPGVPAELRSAAVTSYAAHDIAVGDGRLLMLMILCGVFEIAGSAAIAATLAGKREPGDFALLGGFSKVDGKRMAALKQAEIKHCRLGMMAFGGIATQTAVQGGEIGFPYF